MRKEMRCVVVASLILTASLVTLTAPRASAVAFSPNLRVNGFTAQDQMNATIAVDAAGAIHVVWEDYQIGTGHSYSAIYYAKSTNGGATFSIGIPVTNPPPLNARQKLASIATSVNGWIHVTWTDVTNSGPPTGGRVEYARWRTGQPGFDSPILVSDSAMGDEAKFVVSHIAAYGSGTCQLHVIWAADDVAGVPNPVHLRYDRSATCGDSGSWGADFLVDSIGYDGSLDIAGDGSAGVAYSAGTSDQANIYFKMRIGTSWTNAVQVSQSPPSKYDKDATLAFDPSAPPTAHTVHIAWADGRNINVNDPLTSWNYEIFYSRSQNGVNFGANVLVNDALSPPDTTLSEQSEPSIGVDAVGNPRMAWTDWRHDDDGHRNQTSSTQDADIYYDQSTNGGASFGTDQRIDDDQPIRNGAENARPMLVDVTSDIDIVWQDGRVAAYGLDVYFSGTNVLLGSPTGIKVNEVMFKPVCPGDQWIELHNTASLPVYMPGMELTDEDTFNYRFPSTMPVAPPGGYVVVHLSAGIDETYFGQTQPNALHLYTGDSGWQRHTMDPFLYSAGGVVAADFNGDGKVDIVAGEGFGNGNALYYYTAPADATAPWTKTTIDSGWGNVWVLATGDIDLDGDPDLLAGQTSSANTPDQRLTWYENTPSGWVRHPVETTLTAITDVSVRDVDLDGYPDLLASTFWTQRIYWYKNDGSPGNGGWVRHTISTAWGPGIAVADFDGDAKPDVFSSRDLNNPNNDVGWYKNGASEPWSYLVVRSFAPGGTNSSPPYLAVADVDGDGHLDVASGATPASQENSHVYWYENQLDLNPPGWTSHVVDTDSYTAGWWGGVETGDVNRDGKADIVAALRFGNKVTLFRNNLGGTPEWVKDVVDGSLSGPDEVVVAQLDDSCWRNVIATDNSGNAMYWYTKRVLDATDQVSLYSGSVHDPTTLIDFVAWGGNAGTDDDIAIAAGQWPSGGVFVGTAGILADQTIGRDAASSDTNTPSDWAIRMKTPGAPNV